MNQTFQVQGMTCNHCAAAVTQAVRAVDAEAGVQVNLSTGQVEVDSKAGRAEITAAIEEEGYRVGPAA